MRTSSILSSILLVAALLPGPAAAGEPGILISRQLLESRGLSVGDVVSLSTERSGRDATSFRIVGVYEPTPDPFRLTARRWEVRLHLPDLLRLTADPADPIAAESVDRINVALRDPADVAAFERDVPGRAPGVTAFSTASRHDALTFRVLRRFHQAIALVAVLGSTAFLLALMVMRADERRQTVGILRLIGLSKPRILLEVLVEGLLVAVSGALAGVLFAVAMEGAFNRFFQWHYDTALVFVRVTPGIAAECVALAVPLGVLAGVVASWTLLRRDIVALLRR